MTQRPHFRRETVLQGPSGPVWCWTCRTLDRIGYGMDWRTAWDAWRAHIYSLPLPLACDLHAHTDRTLQ